MTDFTPGPWTWADRGLLGVRSPDIGIYIEDSSRLFRCGSLIGSLKTTDNNRNVQTANAQLIAAAPTMHELLQEVEKYLYQHARAWPSGEHPLHTQVKEMLALADGSKEPT